MTLHPGGGRGIIPVPAAGAPLTQGTSVKHPFHPVIAVVFTLLDLAVYIVFKPLDMLATFAIQHYHIYRCPDCWRSSGDASTHDEDHKHATKP